MPAADKKWVYPAISEVIKDTGHPSRVGDITKRLHGIRSAAAQRTKKEAIAAEQYLKTLAVKGDSDLDTIRSQIIDHILKLTGGK